MEEYSNLSEPAFHSSGGSDSGVIYNVPPCSSSALKEPTTPAVITSTQDASVEDTSINTITGDQTHVQPHQNLLPSIPEPSTMAVSQSSTEDTTLHLTAHAPTSIHTAAVVHTLTEGRIHFQFGSGSMMIIGNVHI